MIKKAHLTALTAAFLISIVVGTQLAFTVAANFSTTKDALHIRIRADGSVEGTDKIQRSGNTYTFIDDIYGALSVLKDEIIIDGASNVLKGCDSYGTPYFSTGISINGRNNIVIRNLEVRSFQNGIVIGTFNDGVHPNIESWGISVSDCYIHDNYCGILLDTWENVISGNNITRNSAEGIRIQSSNRNEILGNFIAYNYVGINFHESFGNSIIGNALEENKNQGMALYSSSGENMFYHNNFINNHVEDGLQVLMPGTGSIDNIVNANSWDYNGEGNYWSAYYTRYPNATEIGSSGLGDTPFFINENNIDWYPLLQPFTYSESSNVSGTEVFPTTLFIAAVLIGAVIA